MADAIMLARAYYHGLVRETTAFEAELKSNSVGIHLETSRMTIPMGRVEFAHIPPKKKKGKKSSFKRANIYKQAKRN